MNYYNNYRPEMLKFIPVGAKKILEVGCGEGLFGEQLIKNRKVEVWGVEPAKGPSIQASKRLFKIINENYDENIILPENYFDCIIFNDVLEHMLDPWKILELSKRFLKSEYSFIVASIPNFRYWDNVKEIIWDGEFTYKPSGILDKTHLRFFTKSSIIKLFNDTGFNVERIEGINPTASRKFKLINLLVLNKINDMQYLQFGVVAKTK